MKSTLENMITSLKSNKIFLLLKRISLFNLKHYYKFHIRLLYIVSENPILYFIYIFLVAYTFFGCNGTVECTASHHISFFLVGYLMSHSAEIYLLYRFERTRNFLYTLVGKEFLLKYLGDHTFSKQLVKYWAVLWGFTFLEIITMDFGLTELKHNQNILDKVFEEAYGSDQKQWDDEIRAEYQRQHFALLNPKYNYGAVTKITHKANFESLYKKFIELIK